MNVFPVFFRLRGRVCLVVGGSEAVAAKTRLLRAAGATVTVIAPTPVPALRGLAEDGEITVRREPFDAVHLAGVSLVIAATGDRAEDAAVSAAARDAGIPVNVVDRPTLSDFIIPAIIDRGAVVVALSTGGAAPVLARRLRRRIESLLPSRLGALAQFAQRFRGAVAATIDNPGERRRFWERFFDGPIAADLLRGDSASAPQRMLSLINRPTRPAGNGGIVHIVGAGPGDPDLLTLRALRVLQDADVVVHDRLIGPDILDYARRDAERIYVGKTKGNHSRPQAEINALLADHAGAGRRVVRLKGGDPFVFGRGGEELDYLLARGVAVEIVPGITAATGCAAYAGIPLTHRDHATAVTFLSGHAKDGEPDLDWDGLVRGRQTLVVYMGVSTAGRIADRLIGHGMAPSTPAAIIENGTLPTQRTVTVTVGGLERAILENDITGPALLVIGGVAHAAAATPQPWTMAAAE